MPTDEQESTPPYVIEGARSDRSRCKTCRRKITRGSLRIGMLIEGPFGAGYLWHHLKCAARQHWERVEEAYELEAWKEAKEVPKRVPPIYELRELKRQSEQKRQTRRELPYAEIAPSGRSRCRHCGQPVAEGSARVVVGQTVEFGRQVRTSPIKVHPQCVPATLAREDSATPREGFADSLRQHSADLPEETLDEILDQVGALD